MTTQEWSLGLGSPRLSSRISAQTSATITVYSTLNASLLSSSPLNLEPLVSASSSRDTESKLRSNSDSSSGFSEEEEDDGLYEEDEEESKSCDDEEIS